MNRYFLPLLSFLLLFGSIAFSNNKKDTLSNPPIACSPYSTLPCTNLQITLPYSLSFNADVPGTITDKNGLGTGFTMALPYSGARLSVDGIASQPDVPGYEASKITITQGRLTFVTNKGIDYLTNNNQINTLGVKVLQSGKLTVEVSLINPFNGTQSQQAGIWYGLDDHTFIKLTISGNKVELRRERNDISSTLAGVNNPDQRITPVVTNLNTKTVRLRLIIDSATNTVEGFYSTNGGTSYTSTGVGYQKTSVKIDDMGISGAVGYAAIYATHRNATNTITYMFDDFNIKSEAPATVTGNLKFSADSLTYTTFTGGDIKSQSVVLSANAGSPAISLSAVNAPWLKLPLAALGTLNFNSSNISSNLAPGTYKGFIIAQANGYQSDTLCIRLIVISNGINNEAINVNFQDPATIPPTNWLRDFGQAYGFRTGLYQSAGLQYGWRKRSDATPINITSNGFNRNVPEDVTLATLIYMQANNITGTFPGSKIQSYWEIKVPNGTYDVSVSVGDGQLDSNSQSHNINVEGVKAITAFIPSGNSGSATRFKQTTVRVAVKDEHITINADGGTNTKINSAQISPVSVSPFTGWSNPVVNLVTPKGTVTPRKFSLMVGNSDNKSVPYIFSVTYNTGTPGWLSYQTSQTGVMPVLTFDYAAAASLPVGAYSVAIKVAATGYTSSYTNIYLRVVDGNNPYVISSSPANASTNISLSTVSVAANNLHVPAVPGFIGGVDNSTITNSTVKLVKVVDGVITEVPGVVQGTGGGDAISFSPSLALEPNTTYRFSITNGVKSHSGAAFTPFSSMFVTAEAKIDTSSNLNAQFTKVAMAGTSNKKYTTLRIGPDDKFYALRLDGTIERYNINHTNGTLSNQQVITTLTTKYGARSAIGLVFDPQSTAGNLVCYVTHSSSGLTNSPSFDGNISKLSGNNLQNETLIVTKLPRSTRDHMPNSLQFGPDGALYLSQGSNSSAGAYDNDWQRAESLLSGTILRVDMAKLNALPLPLNVQTTPNQNVINAAPANSILMSDGTYNPYSNLSPLTIYASGVRNAYDLLWHSNGQLYIPTNGSGGGGNSPASVAGTRRPNGSLYSGPVIPATTGVQVQNDWLFRVNPLKGIGYFGHPNPLRGEYVENRGFEDNPLYAPTIIADANYRGAAYNFGLNHSPNGVIEYKSNTFNGVLKNKLLVCRFSGGGDIVVMEPGSLVKDPSITANSNDHIYDIVKVTTGSGNNGLVGMSGFANPINLIEDTTNGNLYVIEYNWNVNPNLVTQITLLRVNTTASAPTALLKLSADKAADIEGLITYKSYDVSIANRGDGVLKVKDIRLSGPDAEKFVIQGLSLPQKNSPLIIKKNTSLSFTVNAPANAVSNRTVKLRVTSLEDSVKEVDLNLQPEVIKSPPKDSSQFNINIKDKAVNFLKVYPNPNHGDVLHIQLKNYRRKEDITIYLFDMMGNQLKSFKAETDYEGNYSTSMQLSKIKNIHFYILRAVSSFGTKEAKVIID